ncbi:hypothetical protein Sjap_014866 [Stephania japonica]|uniref:Uncharacterized protein n=1 Tax=Stephania japonica TaxID=461633 RepID=A0AAP0II26_9MAGN
MCKWMKMRPIKTHPFHIFFSLSLSHTLFSPSLLSFSSFLKLGEQGKAGQPLGR